ncbi:MAG: hypothetical protein HY898_27030 [Deltaproteobacteria bacterium]|nr:hypothetical protein [Deltaproteobacteria bacterium]
MATVFSRSTRVLACNNCGAPLDVGVQAGAHRCAYCQATNQVSDRVDSMPGAPGLVDTSSVSEAERIQRLREQDAKVWQTPPGLEDYLLGDDLTAEKLAAARQQWLTARRALQTGASFAEAERLFHLTLILAPTLPDRECRALLESAIELLPDEGFRQVLRCRLAQAAVIAGDVAAAEEWLALVNPRPLMLLTDTAYRIAASHVLRAKGLYPNVLAILGHRAGDVPILDAFEFEAVLLRCDAMENTGQLPAAAAALREHLLRDARALWKVQSALRSGARAPLCPNACTAMHAQVWDELDLKFRPKSFGGWILGAFATGGVGSALLFATGFVLWPVLFGTAQLNCGKNGNGAIAVNTGIWGTLLFFVCLALIGGILGEVRLKKAGIRSFVRVLSAKSELVRGKNSTSTRWNLVIEVSSMKGLSKESTSVTQDTPVAPGYYPCIIDPINPKNRSVWFGVPIQPAS